MNLPSFRASAENPPNAWPITFCAFIAPKRWPWPRQFGQSRKTCDIVEYATIYQKKKNVAFVVTRNGKKIYFALSSNLATLLPWSRRACIEVYITYFSVG